jgi:hypothetical protein
MGWGQVAWFVATLIVSYALAPKPKTPDRPTLKDVKAPTADRGRSIPLVLGRRLVAPNVLWYGHLKTLPVKAKSK